MFWVPDAVGLLIVAVGVLTIVFRVRLANLQTRWSKTFYGRYAVGTSPLLFVFWGCFALIAGLLFTYGAFSAR
jgi:hypothetical protein